MEQSPEDVCKQILVVEDEGLIAADIQKRLQRMGYAVPAVARTGEEALLVAQANRPDLVLMDIRLAGAMDGIATAQALKARHDLPVVYVTAHADRETIRRAKLTEPHGYVLKPIADGDLRSAVEIAIYKHEMERRVRTSEAWLAATLHSIGEGVVATNPAGEIVFLNPAAEGLTGWLGKDAQGLLLMDVLGLRDLSLGLPAKNPVYDLLAGESRNYMLLSKAGAAVQVEVACFENWSDNELLGAIVTVRNIAARREMEDRLIEAQRLEAAAHLAGAVAHDLNNQLTLILGNAEALEASLTSSDREPVAEIQRAAATAGSLARHLITLSRTEPGHPEELEWNGLVAGMQPLLAHTLGKGRAAAFTPGSPAGFVRADRAQLQQMLLLLAGQAAKTMPAAGELTMETCVLEVEQSSTSGLPPGGYVRTVVSFPGGAAEEKRARSLELLLVQSIVAQNGGHFRLVDEAVCPRQLEILLPAIGAFHSPRAEDREGPPSTILLAEEEDGVRRMMRGGLVRCGYAVLEARNPLDGEALARLSRCPVDLLIANAFAPGNSGTDIEARLRQLWPDARTLWITGYRHDTPDLPGAGGNTVLSKPFVLPELLRRVRILLEAAPVTI